jgi:hypothetical protein
MEVPLMALWRNPLDELIDDLERTLPQAKATCTIHEVQQVLLEQQWAVGVILWGSEEEKARVMHTQRFHNALKGVWSGPDPSA